MQEATEPDFTLDEDSEKIQTKSFDESSTTDQERASKKDMKEHKDRAPKNAEIKVSSLSKCQNKTSVKELSTESDLPLEDLSQFTAKPIDKYSSTCQVRTPEEELTKCKNKALKKGKTKVSDFSEGQGNITMKNKSTESDFTAEEESEKIHTKSFDESATTDQEGASKKGVKKPKERVPKKEKKKVSSFLKGQDNTLMEDLSTEADADVEFLEEPERVQAKPLRTGRVRTSKTDLSKLKQEDPKKNKRKNSSFSKGQDHSSIKDMSTESDSEVLTKSLDRYSETGQVRASKVELKKSKNKAPKKGKTKVSDLSEGQDNTLMKAMSTESDFSLEKDFEEFQTKPLDEYSRNGQERASRKDFKNQKDTAPKREETDISTLIKGSEIIIIKATSTESDVDVESIEDHEHVQAKPINTFLSTGQVITSKEYDETSVKEYLPLQSTSKTSNDQFGTEFLSPELRKTMGCEKCCVKVKKLEAAIKDGDISWIKIGKFSYLKNDLTETQQTNNALDSSDVILNKGILSDNSSTQSTDEMQENQTKSSLAQAKVSGTLTNFEKVSNEFGDAFGEGMPGGSGGQTGIPAFAVDTVSSSLPSLSINFDPEGLPAGARTPSRLGLTTDMDADWSAEEMMGSVIDTASVYVDNDILSSLYEYDSTFEDDNYSPTSMSRLVECTSYSFLSFFFFFLSISISRDGIKVAEAQTRLTNFCKIPFRQFAKELSIFFH